MLFVWGTKIKRKKLGWVAEFCPTCREPTPFKVFSLRSASRIYFFTSRNNGTVGHEIRYSKCKTRHPADAFRYSGVSRVAGVRPFILAEEAHQQHRFRQSYRIWQARRQSAILRP